MRLIPVNNEWLIFDFWNWMEANKLDLLIGYLVDDTENEWLLGELFAISLLVIRGM